MPTSSGADDSRPRAGSGVGWRSRGRLLPPLSWRKETTSASDAVPAATGSHAIPSVGQILQQAANAAVTLSYSGTITYQRRGAAENFADRAFVRKQGWKQNA